MKPKVWLAKVRQEYPQQRNEQPTAYANRLYPLMQKAAVTRDLAVRNLSAPASRLTGRCTRVSANFCDIIKLLRFLAGAKERKCARDLRFLPPASSAA